MASTGFHEHGKSSRGVGVLPGAVVGVEGRTGLVQEIVVAVDFNQAITQCGFLVGEAQGLGAADGVHAVGAENLVVVAVEILEGVAGAEVELAIDAGGFTLAVGIESPVGEGRHLDDVEHVDSDGFATCDGRAAGAAGDAVGDVELEGVGVITVAVLRIFVIEAEVWIGREAQIAAGIDAEEFPVIDGSAIDAVVNDRVGEGSCTVEVNGSDFADGA